MDKELCRNNIKYFEKKIMGYSRFICGEEIINGEKWVASTQISNYDDDDIIEAKGEIKQALDDRYQKETIEAI